MTLKILLKSQMVSLFENLFFFSQNWLLRFLLLFKEVLLCIKDFEGKNNFRKCGHDMSYKITVVNFIFYGIFSNFDLDPLVC